LKRGSQAGRSQYRDQFYVGSAEFVTENAGRRNNYFANQIK
jgi:hypothetical protein